MSQITTAAQILALLGPSCRDNARRALLLEQTQLNGIDFIEFERLAAAPPPPATQYVLHVHFLLGLPPGAYGLATALSQMLVHGGTRITGISVKYAAPSAVDPFVLDVYVDQQGDYSPYLLSIGWSRDDTGHWVFQSPSIDRLFSVAPINFRPGCPVDFDCAPTCDCPEDLLEEPALDYLAKDYASFRQLLLDLVAQRNPGWTEQSPADIGIALLELFAYVGDNLSYFQDAVANEAFLDTARQRVSAKRHAKLIDYQMHDGRNAWTFVHFAVETAGSLGPGTQLVTRITAPMRYDRQPGVTPIPRPVGLPGAVLNVVLDEDYATDPALAQVRVFETATTATVDPLENELRLHPWGNLECCLPHGTTAVHVYAVDQATGTAVLPPLHQGDYVLLEEVRGPETGAPADADPSHRQVVLIAAEPVQMSDELFLAGIDPATGEPRSALGAPPGSALLPLLELTFAPADALTFALCLSSKLTDGTPVPRVSVARGNIALADHGRTILEHHPPSAADGTLNDYGPPLDGSPAFRLRLNEGPQTMQCPPGPSAAPSFDQPSERPNLTCDVRQAQPAVALRATRSNGDTEDWFPAMDLLGRTEPARHFVVDVDDLGHGVLRFGDGVYGQRLIDVTHIAARYRVGNGSSGNIGADSLAHVVKPSPVPAQWPSIAAVRNPLAAIGGVEPELIEEVREHAPAAFRATQLRAVTADDYRRAALTVAGVADAVASFRWTGSWYTVFVGIDPVNADNVLTNARGVAQLEAAFRQGVLDALTRYRLAGYDLEIRAARYVPLDVDLQLCVKRGYFPGDVAHAVSAALGSGVDPRFGPGLFNPANLTFGMPVYLSRIYAAVENVAGVESATVTTFKRHGHDPAGELRAGVLQVGPWEIARLDNDPSNMENGTLQVSAGGGP